jgi:hypothetical protein
MKPAMLLVAALMLMGGLGCESDKLETGYAYTPLGDSSSKRRGYYADPFSPEARAAQMEQQTNAPAMGNNRQIPGQ